MSAQLADTNVLGELARHRPNPGVLRWAQGQQRIALSAVTVEEIHFGLAWRPNRRIAEWLATFIEGCEVLAITAEVAVRSGEIRGRLRSEGRTRHQADMLIAATALVERRTLVTRNVRDFDGLGVALLDPFE